MSSFTPRPHRLAEIFSQYSPPLYFVTFCTADRHPTLAFPEVHHAFTEYSGQALAKASVAVGRYVIMPDHIHLFVRGPEGFILGNWIRGLKWVLSKGIRRVGTPAPQQAGQKEPVWQTGFFDHIIRHSESYREKWAYVAENPVRAGLVKIADEWPYQGEVTIIDRA